MTELEPVTREEQFMAKAAGQDVPQLEPITRKEKFLSRMGGGGGAAQKLDVSLDADSSTLKVSLRNG